MRLFDLHNGDRLTGKIVSLYWIIPQMAVGKKGFASNIRCKTHNISCISNRFLYSLFILKLHIIQTNIFFKINIFRANQTLQSAIFVTLKNTRAPLLCHFKLFASFFRHQSIQTGVTVQKWQIWNKKRHFWSHVTFKIWGMTFKKDRATFLCHFKLFASLHRHPWIQTGVPCWKHQIQVKMGNFL